MAGDTIECRPCKGTGLAWEVGPANCHYCKGLTQVIRVFHRTVPCGPCKGTGRRRVIARNLCDVCGGYGSNEPPQAKPAQAPGSLVYYVKGGEPYTDRKLLESVLGELHGDVCVCDPYYGPGVLAALANLKGYKSVRCLTRYLGDAGKAVAEHDIGVFKRQYPTQEFRLSNSGDLHDRYVLANNGLLLLGHGLKDFGHKETFLIMLDEEFAPLETVKATFEGHWAAARTLG